jgi:hypothetical protein
MPDDERLGSMGAVAAASPDAVRVLTGDAEGNQERRTKVPS